MQILTHYGPPCLMTHFPKPHRRQRSRRAEFHRMIPASIRFEDSRHESGKLRTISLTGGLLRLSKTHVPGTLVEVVFISRTGPVVGIAELLNPVSLTLRCQQPFKFIMIDDENYRRLNSLIEASLSARTD
jgi:hypothetical protein